MTDPGVHFMNPGQALDRAAAEANAFRGATAPNPPVGAVLLDAEGRLLSVGAHTRAGAPHAEIAALEAARANGTLGRAHTLVVTLEPCNHRGRTGPCTEAILNAPIRQVIFAESDANPKAQGGAARLRQAGISVAHHAHGPSRELVRPFFHWLQTGLPWVTLKIARRIGAQSGVDPTLDPKLQMIPDPGQKTFTSPEALRLAHELRRRADAIVTGSGTILADHPEFTVRHVEDHAPNSQKRRWLAILDRRQRVPETYLAAARARGFDVGSFSSFQAAMEFLGQKGVHEVLVEAGPTLTESIESRRLWNERFVIEQDVRRGGPLHDRERIVHDVYGNC